MIELNPSQIPDDLKKYFKPKRKYGPWTCRNSIIWEKGSCMPSSAKDRFTVSHEYIFFFSKQRRYYFEQQFEKSVGKNMPGTNITDTRMTHGVGGGNQGIKDTFQKYKKEGYPSQRNCRTVWHVNPKPYPEAHFAVFPAELIETPIKAGCPLHGVVLDPFVGSGTTLQVCKRLNRSSIGIDIQDNYKELIEKRIRAKDKSIESFF